MRNFGKIAKKFQKTKIKSSSANFESNLEEKEDFSRSTISEMDEDVFKAEDPQEEEVKPRNLHEEKKITKAHPLQKLYDLLDISLCDVKDEITVNKCHALVAFHKLMVSQREDLNSKVAEIATLSNVNHVENNPLLDYLSSALTLKVEEIIKWNPDLLEATVSSSSGDIMLPENERS